MKKERANHNFFSSHANVDLTIKNWEIFFRLWKTEIIMLITP